MQITVDLIYRETKKLSRPEKMQLLEKLIRQLRREEDVAVKRLSWENMYGIGKGIWDGDAQEYVNALREERT